MRLAGLLQGMAVCAAVMIFCLPQPLPAASTTATTPSLIDVELAEGGVLLGQLVDPEGLPKADAAVLLLNGNQKLAEARTDDRGTFAFRGLRGGVYQLTAAEGVGAYRLWAPGTAPPSAQPGAMLVAGMDLIRGQCYYGGCCDGMLRNCGSWLRFHLSNPFVLAAITATAITVPILIHEADDDGPVSPP